MKTKKTTKRPRRRSQYPGISRIDQPSTRTHGWFVRADFYRVKKRVYAPRHRKFFGDVSHGGKRSALKAAQRYLATVTRPTRAARPARPASPRSTKSTPRKPRRKPAA